MDVQPFDVNDAAVEFDGRRLMHKNAPFVGDRYCLVFFNPDFSYHDTHLTHPHAKTEELRCIDIAPPHEIARVNTDEQRKTRAILLTELGRTSFVCRPKGRGHGKYPYQSRTLVFGKTRSRGGFDGINSKMQDAPANETHAPLLAAIYEYMRALIGAKADAYAGVFVSHNSECAWHYDKSNVGGSVLTCIGPFTGGELMIDIASKMALACAKCKKGNHGVVFCRKLKGHTSPEWWDIYG